MRHRLQSQRGTVLMVAMILVLLMTGLAVAYVAITGSQALQSYVSYKSDRALYVAEAGLADSMLAIQSGGIPTDQPATMELEVSGGSYAVATRPEGNMYLMIESRGDYVDTERTVRVVAYQGIHPMFNHAIFAGDSIDDPDYWLDFGGIDGGANRRDQDEINGNVYSGENVLVGDDATINGAIEAAGEIVGADGSRFEYPIPDIKGMDYPNNHDINVNEAFELEGFYSTLRSADYGAGMALPETNPAHIFHLNPTDRQVECDMTPGDDFFMEDIYENNPKFNTRISVAPGGNDKVYFMVGDLWINNKNLYSFQLKNPDTHITIVVQGDIHIADDFHYHNDIMSGVAFIAIQAHGDPHGEHSGNIYLGDPTEGTLSEINAFLYAENNFVDQNLDESGSVDFYINGMMSAGNHVSLLRDYTGAGYWKGAYPHRWWQPDPDTEMVHSKMTVDLDDRIFTGQLILPGLPKIDPGTGQWIILAWHEIS